MNTVDSLAFAIREKMIEHQKAKKGPWHTSFIFQMNLVSLHVNKLAKLRNADTRSFRERLDKIAEAISKALRTNPNKKFTSESQKRLVEHLAKIIFDIETLFGEFYIDKENKTNF